VATSANCPATNAGAEPLQSANFSREIHVLWRLISPCRIRQADIRRTFSKLRAGATDRCAAQRIRRILTWIWCSSATSSLLSQKKRIAIPQPTTQLHTGVQRLRERSEIGNPEVTTKEIIEEFELREWCPSRGSDRPGSFARTGGHRTTGDGRHERVFIAGCEPA
jgi:hypothetical protein